MAGFLLIIDNNLSDVHTVGQMESVVELDKKSRKLGADSLIEYYSNGKFENDKLFNEDKELFICTDGVFLGIDHHQDNNGPVLALGKHLYTYIDFL